jgi:hypothetical protein
MKIGGQDLRDHIRLLAPLFGFIAAVWALRMVLYAADAPRVLVRVCSVSVAGPAAVLMAAILIHVRRFGGYANIVVAAVLLHCFQQLLISAAIGFSALTGMMTVYAAPEYSFTMSPAGHIAAHLTLGMAFASVSAGMGCLFLWMLRKIVPQAMAR